MKLLVTGGAGFIGSCFVRQTIAADPSTEIVVLDKLTYAGNLENLAPVADNPRSRFKKGDICDAPLVDRLMNGSQARRDRPFRGRIPCGPQHSFAVAGV